MAIDDDIAFLERVPTLSLLGRQALRILAIGAVTRQVDRGEVLFRAGEQADGGFVVQQGSFRLSQSEEGEEITVGPCTLLGEVALFAETRRRTTAEALEPSIVLSIPPPLLLRMLDSLACGPRRWRETPGSGLADASLESVKVQAFLAPYESKYFAGLYLEYRRHRHVIGWSRRAAHMLHHLHIAEPVGERRRDPDVIEPAPLVSLLPIGRAITPPGVELRRFGHPHAHGIDPAALLLGGDELLALERCVRHDP